MKIKQILLFSSAVGAIAGLAGAASAATVAGAAATSDSAATVGEVVVTAEKREQSIQKVPVSISVFTSAQRDLKGIETIQDITNFTPGLVYNSSNDRASLRGVGRLTNTMTVDGAVAVYSDNFYTTSTVEAALDSLFTDRVEILRGPQGTLFGRNAIGGLINVISRRPTDYWYAEVRTTQGSYGLQQYEGAVSGPITDGLNFRLAASKTNQYAGFFNNVVPNKPSEGVAENQYYVAGYLDGKLGSHADFWVKYAASGWDNHGGPGTRIGYQAGPTDIDNYSDTKVSSYFFNPAYGYGPEALNPTKTGPETNNPAIQNIRDFASNTQLTFNLHNVNIFDAQFTWHFPSFDMKYTGGIYTYDYDVNYGNGQSVTSYQIPLAAGVSGTPLTVFPTIINQGTDDEQWYSNEVTFSSTTSGPVQWIAGAYFYTQNSDVGQRQLAPDQPQVKNPILFGGGVAPINPSSQLAGGDFRSLTKSEAGYGQVDWRVTDTIKLTGGLRYTSDQKTGTEELRVIEFALLGGDPSKSGNTEQAVDVTRFAGACEGQMPSCAKTGTPPGVTSKTSAASLAAGIPVISGANITAQGFQYRSLAANSSAVTGTAGIEWTPDNNTLAYFRYSRGYKSVGLNGGTLVNEPIALPESLDSFEVGLKKTFGRTLVLDGSIYYYNYDNLQLPIGTLVNILGVQTVQSNLINVPNTRLDGFEMDAIWSPLDHLVITTTYSFNDSSIQSGCSLVNGKASGACFVDSNDPGAAFPGAKAVGPLIGTNAVQSVKGQQLPETPRNKMAINANYTFEFEPGNLILSASYIWRDVTYSTVFNRPYNEAPSWDQVDLRATWKSKTDKYEIIGYVKNVFDTVGYQAASGASAIENAQPNGQGQSSSVFLDKNFALTDPRTFGVEMHYKFF